MTCVGILYEGDARDRAAKSGVVRGLTDALLGLGFQTHYINVLPPRTVQRVVRRVPILHPEQCAYQSRIAQARLSAAPKLDAIIQIGTGYTISTAVPTATYEDMTVAQHELHRVWWFMGLPGRARRAWSRRQHASYVNATACCVASEWARQSVVADYGVDPAKVHVVGLGGNHILAEPVERDWSKPRFLIVARDWRIKNVALVIRTFGRLRREVPLATLDVVGPYPGPGGPGVTLHGPLRLDVPEERATVERLFRRATVYVSPSTHEAAGNAFVEAGWSGIPSIGTCFGGNREIIGSGGMVVDPRDGEQLFRAMKDLTDPETTARLGAHARTHAQWYTWPKTATRLLRALGVTS